MISLKLKKIMMSDVEDPLNKMIECRNKLRKMIEMATEDEMKRIYMPVPCEMSPIDARKLVECANNEANMEVVPSGTKTDTEKTREAEKTKRETRSRKEKCAVVVKTYSEVLRKVRDNTSRYIQVQSIRMSQRVTWCW